MVVVLPRHDKPTLDDTKWAYLQHFTATAYPYLSAKDTVSTGISEVSS